MMNLKTDRTGTAMARTLIAIALSGAIAACTSFGGTGPRSGAIKGAEDSVYDNHAIRVVPLNDATLSRLDQYGDATSFARLFGDAGVSPLIIGEGDVLDVAIWEAPPAVLFGVTTSDVRLAANPQVAQSASIPQQMVSEDGVITVPFIGKVPVAGKTPAQIESFIVSRLRGRAHDPQVVVRLVQNEARNVTILGEVNTSRQLPLTGKGERILDAIARAGGTRNPVDKSSVQLARGQMTASMPLERIIQDPSQNVRLKPDDVLAVLHQPFSFIALGAVARSAEVPFEGTGLTLAQALGRIGGLDELRANIRGVFVFRMEDPAALGAEAAEAPTYGPDGRVPVIYNLDMSDPVSLFAMQDFAVRDDDVLYVSTAPAADLQRFISFLSSTAFSTIAIGNAIN